MKNVLVALLNLMVGCQLWGQIGGKSVFNMLALPQTARITALGNSLVVVKEDDLGVGLVNPSLLNPANHQSLMFSHEFLPAGIQHGYFGYGHHSPKLNTTFQGAVQYMRYGEFQAADEFGNQTGTFRAADYAFLLGAGRQLSNHLSVGCNLKFVTSQLETYRSSALGFDMAATYLDTASRFGITLLYQNLGVQLTTYEVREKLPYNLSISVSKKLKYLPFRGIITMHHINRWNMLYDDPNAENNILFNGNETQEQSKFSQWTDNLFRHLTFGGEFLFGKREVLRVRFAYNHQIRKELSVSNYRSLAGFSAGFGITIKQFRLDYGFGKNHLAGGTNQFTLSTNLTRFRK